MFLFKLYIDDKLYSPDTGEWIETLITQFDEYSKLDDKDLEYFARYIRDDIKLNIISGQDFEGNALLPLMPSTLSRKFNSRILQDTGLLLSSITYEKVSTGVYDVFTDVHYAGYLQYGTSKMVSRPFFGLTQRAETLIDEYFNNYNLNQRIAA